MSKAMFHISKRFYAVYVIHPTRLPSPSASSSILLVPFLQQEPLICQELLSLISLATCNQDHQPFNVYPSLQGHPQGNSHMHTS